MVDLTEEGRVVGSRVSALLDELDVTVRRTASSRDVEGFHRVLTAIEEAAHDGR